MKAILVGGCDRSGTTMLGAMLGAHQRCICIPESQFKFEMLRRWDWQKQNIGTREVLRWLSSLKRFRLLWELESDSKLPSEIALSYKDTFEWLIEAYAKKINKPDVQLWVDHSPSNIRHVWSLKNIFREIKIIHIVRDGRAVAASIMPLDWGPNTIIKAAHFWAEKVCYGLAAESCFDEMVIRIKYEDLVSNPVDTLKKLCSWLNLKYEPNMSLATGFKVTPYCSDQHALIGEKPDRSRLNAWIKQLNNREVEIFEGLTNNLLPYLGYEPIYGAKARPFARREKLFYGVQEIYSRLTNKIRYQKKIRNLYFERTLYSFKQS
jgi:hypothetical protein